MTDVFFTATKKALSNITSTYDTVWPTAVGLWNLRCMVNGVKKEYPCITETELTAKFSLGSGIHGVNYKRAFVDHPILGNGIGVIAELMHYCTVIECLKRREIVICTMDQRLTRI